MNDDVCVGIITNMSREVKRVDLFIKMADNVLQKRRKVKFLVLEDGELRGRLIEMTENLGIQEDVMFLGRDVSKHKVLSAMDIGVLTSDSEAFSNAIMEYMAAGLPVVATDVGGNSQLVENHRTGFLVGAGDFEALGDKIIQLVDNKSQRVEFGVHGNERIAGYDWPKVIDHVVQSYERLIQK